MATLEQAQAVKAAWEAELLAQPYVAGVAVSVVDGQPALVVYLRRPLQPREWLPPFLDGVPLVARVTGPIGPLKATTERWRPAPGGVSIAHRNVSAGTLGAVLYLDGAPLVASNNHILAWTNLGALGDPILQPGPADGGLEPGDTIATLWWFQPISELAPNRVDFALGFPLDPGWVTDSILGLSPARDLILLDVAPGQAQLGMGVIKSGRSTGLTFGTVVATDAAFVVDMGPFLALFEDVILVEGEFAAGGDSGSAVLDRGTGDLLGLLFAGSAGLTLVCKVGNITRLLAQAWGFRPAQQARWRIPLPLTLGLGFLALGGPALARQRRPL